MASNMSSLLTGEENMRSKLGTLTTQIGVAAGVELVVEVRLRSGVEPFDLGGERALFEGLRRVFHQFAQGVDGGVRHRQHQPRDKGERGALPAGHLRGDGGEDVVVEFDDAGLDLLLVDG
jgi:hypothetical protein